MSERTPEFSWLVPLARVGLQPYRTEIEATAEERARLAQRFDLVALDQLSAVVTLEHVGAGLIRLDAAIEAEFAQSCVVTLDPVPDRIAETFSLLYGPPVDDQTEVEVDVDEPVFEPLSGDAIDIGEAVAQELSLALPEFPRLPDAEIDRLEDDVSEQGPFAALERLRPPPQN